MIDQLPDLIPSFKGSEARVRCFAHTLNLVAKAMLKPFDVPKKDVADAVDEAERSLIELAAGLDLEEAELRAGGHIDEEGEGEDVQDDEHEHEEDEDEDEDELREEVMAARVVLVKAGSPTKLSL